MPRGNKLTVNEEIRILERSLMDSRYNMASALGQTFGGERDVYAACGWKKTLCFQDYYNHYKRSNIAGTIIDLMPKECWSEFPTIKEDDEPEDTIFEKEFKELEEKTNLFSNLLRLDKFSGIHQYAVLFLGFDDSGKDNEPVEKAKNLLYVKPFIEDHIEIKELEKNTKNPRYGQPLMYELKVDAEDGKASSTMIVHHSRVLHVAENPVEKNYIGTPRLERVFNNIENIVKISGSGGESYWRGAFPGLGLIMDKDAKLTPTESDAIKEELADYKHNLSRFLKLKGITPEKLDHAPTSSSTQVDTELKLIAFTIRVPKRILEGSERGELSSGQDKDSFNEQIRARRIQYIDPFILRELIDRLQSLGILSEAEYMVDWSELDELTPKEKANNNKTRTETLTIYAKSPEAKELIPPEFYLSLFLGMDDEQIKTILAAAASVQKDEEDQMNQDIIDGKIVEE